MATGLRILLCVTFVMLCSRLALATNDTESDGRCKLNTKCYPGIVLPTWGDPDVKVSTGIRVARAFVYCIVLMYFFLGVSIIADRFMAAIEIITSKEKDITITDKKTGKLRVVTVKIWNETVSNLTLMALGSSAPEILLTVIEVCGKNFEAGELGPSTIVGSAAFNLFVIIAICVYSIPCDDHRQIRHIQVFAVTATCSLFAYVWLYIIVAISSPNLVTIWEGLLTFAFFPLLVIIAWGADRRFNFYRYLRKRVRRQKRQGVVVVQTGDYDVVAVKTKDGYSRNTELDGKAYDMENGDVNGDLDEESELLSHDLTEERKLKAIQVVRQIRQKNPNADKETIDRILEQENLKAQPKSRAFYRIEATRKMVGSGSVLKSKHEKLEQAAAHSIADVDVEVNELEDLERQHITRVFFDPPHYTCMESCGNLLITVIRAGGDTNNNVYVDFKTEDGTAKSGEDYERTEGTLCFKPGEIVKTISVVIIDDDIFEEDEHFGVRLSNIRIAGPDGKPESYEGPAGVLGSNSTAEIVILDDDYPGVFTFEAASKTVPEADRIVTLNVTRQQGARGIVRVPYHTIEGTAKGGGEAFEDAVGELEFDNEEYSKDIRIVIVDDEDYEKRETFQVYLGQPYVVTAEGEEPPPSPGGNTPEEERIRELGKPRLGDIHTIDVSIIESKEFKNTVDRLLAKANLALVVGTSSWREQFADAFTVGGDDDDDGDDTGEPSPPTYGDYLMHYLTLFWKVLFATVPPTDIWSGWACFVVSIIWIGILTMFIGDIASHFGCTVGLSDSVVAISFVALGTSVPDTFASKVAAISDEYADSSIGNVTGSNSVNVFLGVGLAWSLAAIVHAFRGTEFRVEAGSLGFSVLIFCIFAIVAIFVLMLRRHPAVGGVLGGPMKYKLPTTIVLVFLWAMYIILSSLEAYCHFKGF